EEGFVLLLALGFAFAGDEQAIAVERHLEIPLGDTGDVRFEQVALLGLLDLEGRRERKLLLVKGRLHFAERIERNEVTEEGERVGQLLFPNGEVGHHKPSFLLSAAHRQQKPCYCVSAFARARIRSAVSGLDDRTSIARPSQTRRTCAVTPGSASGQ